MSGDGFSPYERAMMAFSDLVKADPTAAFLLWRDAMPAELSAAQAPRLEVVTTIEGQLVGNEDFRASRAAAFADVAGDAVALVEDVDTESALRCPCCGKTRQGVTIVDWDWRNTEVEDPHEMDFDDQEINPYYDSETNWDGLLYQCGGCSAVVRLPEGWDENAVS